MKKNIHGCHLHGIKQDNMKIMKENPTRIIMVLVGFFLCAKPPQSHAGHGVVGKKQSGLKDKLYLGRTMKLLLKIDVV